MRNLTGDYIQPAFQYVPNGPDFAGPQIIPTRLYMSRGSDLGLFHLVSTWLGFGSGLGGHWTPWLWDGTRLVDMLGDPDI